MIRIPLELCKTSWIWLTWAKYNWMKLRFYFFHGFTVKTWIPLTRLRMSYSMLTCILRSRLLISIMDWIPLWEECLSSGALKMILATNPKILWIFKLGSPEFRESFVRIFLKTSCFTWKMMGFMLSTQLSISILIDAIELWIRIVNQKKKSMNF